MSKQTFIGVFSTLALIAVLGFIFIQTIKKQDIMQNDIQNESSEEVIIDDQSATTSDATSTATYSQAVFITNHGEFVLALEVDKAPNTVTNFVELARSGFYNGQRFHRVISGFMIQAGDPNSRDIAKKALWGTGGPGYQFADEFGVGLSNVTGTISMANSGPNTNGSQFFINTNDNLFLDKKHAVFGTVVEGMDVVMKISQVDTDPSDKPLVDVIIESVEIK